jgi:hypothetical protein
VGFSSRDLLNIESQKAEEKPAIEATTPVS